MASQRINSGSQHTQLNTECQGRHGPWHNVNDLFPHSHDQIRYPEVGAQKEVEVDMEVEQGHIGSGTNRGIVDLGRAGDPDDRGEFLETSNQPGSPTDHPEEPPHATRPPGHPRNTPTEGESRSRNATHAFPTVLYTKA